MFPIIFTGTRFKTLKVYFIGWIKKLFRKIVQILIRENNLELFFRIFNLKLSKNDDVFAKDIQITSSSGKNIDYDFFSLVKGTVNGRYNCFKLQHGAFSK